MTNDLSATSEAFLNSAVASGLYSSRADALEAAVELLRQRREIIQRLTESRRQLDDGQFLEFSPDGLRRYFDELLNQAKERARVKQGA